MTGAEYPLWADVLIGLATVIVGALLVHIPKALAVAGVRADEREQEAQRRRPEGAPPRPVDWAGVERATVPPRRQARAAQFPRPTPNSAAVDPRSAAAGPHTLVGATERQWAAPTSHHRQRVTVHGW